MSTSEDRQMLGYLRQITTLSQASSGASSFVTLLERGAGKRDTGMRTSAVEYGRLVVSIYALKPSDPPPSDEKSTTKAASKPASLTVKLNGFLTDKEPILIASETLSKEGQHTVVLPYFSAKYQLTIECEGTAEYAVFGL